MFKGLKNKLGARIAVATLAAGAVLGGAGAFDVVTAEPAQAVTRTQENRWVYLNGTWQCFTGYYYNYSFWEETTQGKRDVWVRDYRIANGWCGLWR